MTQKRLDWRGLTGVRRFWDGRRRSEGRGLETWVVLKDRGGWFLACEVAEPLTNCSALAAEMKGCEAIGRIVHAMFEDKVFWEEILDGMPL